MDKDFPGPVVSNSDLKQSALVVPHNTNDSGN